uniref:Uncharacterized protein n=1 Tax=Esox lucius TaxID=8010 RepID=A0A6Q2YH39_ESOLU
MHSPLPQWNSCVPQVFGVGLVSLPAQFWGHSSEPSAQSASPSQAQRLGTHTVAVGQDVSSEPSEQSLSLSHTNDLAMHWPLEQLNWLSLQVFVAHCNSPQAAGSSSDPSPQSSPPSQTHRLVIHFLLSQLN